MKTIRIAAIGASAMFVVAACGSGSSSSAGPGGGPGHRVASQTVLMGHVEPLHAGGLTPQQVAADDTAFGFDLFAKLCAAQPHANLTLSPASAAQALGMLDAGSVGSTRAKVGALLHLPAWSPAVVAALHGQAQALSQISQIKVSNHVFERTGVSPTQQTLNDLTTAYGADLRQLNFADEPSATNAINAVISKDTDRLIPTLFDSPLDASTQTVLANAILLDAKWADAFPSSESGTFQTAAGPSATATMMQNTGGSFPDRSAAGWESVVLPYQGGKLQAVALLPPSSAAPCAAPSATVMSALTAGPSQSSGVVLPKLNLSLTLSLEPTLAALGLPVDGNFSGLGQRDHVISQVVQKVVMKVDEQGTKAAAATGVGVTSATAPMMRVVTFDRPFLLLLQDTATGTPLFLARVADPNSS